MRWADRIVTVSEASRRAIAAWSGWPERANPRDHRRPRPGLPAAGRRPRGRRRARPARHLRRSARFLLYVGGLSPHKNLLRLVEAFAQAAPGRRQARARRRRPRRLPHPRPPDPRGHRAARVCTIA